MVFDLLHAPETALFDYTVSFFRFISCIILIRRFTRFSFIFFSKLAFTHEVFIILTFKAADVLTKLFNEEAHN